MDTKSSPSQLNQLSEVAVKNHVVGHRQRLKEKLSHHGGTGLADYELLELLLFLVIPRIDTKPLAKTLLERFGGLLAVLSASESTLRDIKGVGDGVVHLFKLAHVILGRTLQEDVKKKNVLQSWQQVINYCTTTMSFADKENLRVLYLDQRNQILLDEIQQTGTVNHTPIYPREVMKRGFEVGATALILVHNHPSGDPTPSKADIDMTLKVQRIGNELGICLHDHVIIGKGKHASFKAMGLL